MRITSVAFAAVCLLPIGTVFGQQSGSGAAGSTKSALLVPNGFTYDADCPDGSLYTGKLVFSEQGDKLSVKIVEPSVNCEEAVELSADSIQFMGCLGYVFHLKHYPSNAYEPFKGRVGGLCRVIMNPK
jgi:hypothetical protein